MASQYGKVSAREAARRRMPLDGADAQAMEGALTLTERERDEAIARAEAAEAGAAGLRKRLDDVLGACWKMEGYAKGFPVRMDTIIRGYQRIRACARGFGDDASKGALTGEKVPDGE